MSDWNAGIIDEFRENEGRVGGMFEGAPLLLLHHVGARTETERVSPLMYQTVNEDFAIFASKAGADTNPDWFHNLMANPQTKSASTRRPSSPGSPKAKNTIASGSSRSRLGLSSLNMNVRRAET